MTKRALTIGTAALAVLLTVIVGQASPVSAHPLGNFTINHYAGLHLSGRMIRVDYVVDLAELPTVTERPALSSGGQEYAAATCGRIAGEVDLGVDGRALPLVAVRSSAALFAGEAGLSTMRIECGFDAAVQLARGEHRVALLDRSWPGRIGWREITVAGYGAAATTTLPMESVSGRLTDFSRNDGANGKTERADLAFTVQNPDLIAPLPGSGDDAQQARKAAQSTDPLSGLLARADAGWGAAFVALLVAAGLGALHGLAPGHGKTVIAAYLVGTKGSRRQAAGLALAVALSHTVGVFALGLVTLAASATLPLERLYTGLRIISAALIIGLGIWLAGRAWFEWRSGKSQRPRLSVGAAVAENRSHDHPHHDDTHHDHAHHDDTHHDQAHHDAGRLHRHGLLPHRHRVAWDNVDLGGAPLSWRALIALGLSGGIVPSASAVIVLLGAVQIGRIPFGAALILAFGVGLSAALVGVGLGVLAISRRTGHLLDATRVGRVIERYTAPLAAAALLSVGVFLLLRALSVF